MKNCLRSIFLLALGSLAATGFAADHRDGPLATGDPAADLNDIYTFMNPNDPTELIVITTYLPAANSNSRFSDVVEYRTFFDNGSANGKFSITCTFPNSGARFNCNSSNGQLSAQGNLNQIVTNGNLRVWAGLRDDPFFFDADAFNRTRAAVAPRFTNPGVNFFGTMNTLAVAFGIKVPAVNNGGANPVQKIWGSATRIGGDGISAGHTGHWLDADAGPGYGVAAEVLGPLTPGGPDRLVVYWGVYDNNGNQMWLFGSGNISGATASVPVVRTGFARFPPLFRSQDVVVTNFGTLDFTFTSCNNARMQVTPAAGSGFSPVGVNLVRFTQVKGLPCTFLNAGQIDREGRPAINTALIDVLASTGKKDQYNRASDPSQWAAMFQSEIQNNLTALDTLDGVTGNALAPPAALASILVDDRLQINTSIPTCNAYLAVELGVAGQCGGRTLARDVIDDSLGAIVGPGVSDFVGNDSVFLTTFPFVGEPQ